MAKRRRGRPASGKEASVRVTASLAPDTYQTLKALASHKKVSVAWVIRDAAENYVTDQWPLLSRTR
jgi:predicted DNA-binding protein